MGDGRKYRIVNVMTTADNNPLTWTEEDIDKILIFCIIFMKSYF